MRHSLLVLLFPALLAGCATSAPVDTEPQHALWVPVPNPLDHELVLTTDDIFLFAMESDHDVTLRVHFQLIAPYGRVIADETRSVDIYHRIPAEVRLAVEHPCTVPQQSQQRLDLRLRVLHQSVQGQVNVRITALGLTISDHNQTSPVDPSPRSFPTPASEEAFK